VIFPFVCSNIPATPAYGVYLSHSRYNIPKACGSYQDFLHRGVLLTRKLLNQGFLLVKLKSSLRMCFYIINLYTVATLTFELPRSRNTYLFHVDSIISLHTICLPFMDFAVFSLNIFASFAINFNNFRLMVYLLVFTF
jgi:hypothetical protein